MRFRLTMTFFMGLLAMAGGAACAQEAPARPMSKNKIEGSCQQSLERFCPELVPLPGQTRNQTRNQVICLKPYRSSLPLSCRSAVTAALR